MKNKIIILAAMLFSAAAAHAQCVLTATTLSSALSTASGQTMVVASATPNSTTTCPNGNFAVGNVAFVDRELVTIKSVSSTTIGIIRGQGGTFAAPHASGAIVFVGQPSWFKANYKQGACTRTNLAVIPIIDVKDGVIFDCIAGQYAGTAANGTEVSAPYRISSPNPGGTAYTSINTSGTAPGAATTMYCTEINLSSAKLLTGLGVLNGTTVGTDKHIMILYDSSGVALANSATAGATTSGASTYQTYAFTSTYFAVPGRYLGCMQTNGTTDTVRMSITGVNDNIIAGAVTGQTFGTVAAITAPTTYTTAVGPYIMAY